MTREEFISQMGYRDDSPLRNEESLDIKTGDNGVIDMTNTGTPLMANGRYLPPYSGYHQFEPNSTVTEIPLAQFGKENSIENEMTTSYQESQNYQRIKNSRKGVRENPDGSHSTHLMSDNDKDEAWPTLFQKEDGSWFEGGYAEAKKRGEIYKFDSKEELIRFARKGDWKNTYKQGGELPKFQDKGEWTDLQLRQWQDVQYNMRKGAPPSDVSDRTTWPAEYQLGYWEDAKALYDWWPDTSTKEGRSKAYNLHRATKEKYPTHIAGYYFAPGHNNGGKMYPYGSMSTSEEYGFKMDNGYWIDNVPEEYTEWMNDKSVKVEEWIGDEGGYEEVSYIPKSRWSDEIDPKVMQHIFYNEEAQAEAMPYIKFRFEKKQDALDFLNAKGYSFEKHPLYYYDEDGEQKMLVVPSMLSKSKYNDLDMNDVVIDSNYIKLLDYYQNEYINSGLANAFESMAATTDDGRTGFEMYLNEVGLNPSMKLPEEIESIINYTTNPIEDDIYGRGELISNWQIIESEEDANSAVKYAGDNPWNSGYNWTDSDGNNLFINNPNHIPRPIASGGINSVPFFFNLFTLWKAPVTALATKVYQPIRYVGGLSIPGTSVSVGTGVNAAFAYDFGRSAYKNYLEGETGWGIANSLGSLLSLNGAYRGYQTTLKLFPESAPKLVNALGLTSKPTALSKTGGVSLMTEQYKWGELANGINNNVKPFSLKNLIFKPGSKYHQTTQLGLIEGFNKANKSGQFKSLYEPLKMERSKGALSFISDGSIFAKEKSLFNFTVPRGFNTRQPYTLANNKTFYTPDKLTNIKYNRMPWEVSDYSKVTPLKSRLFGNAPFFHPKIGIQPYNPKIIPSDIKLGSKLNQYTQPTGGLFNANKKYSLFDDAGNAIINNKSSLFNRQPSNFNIGEYVPFQNVNKPITLYEDGGQLPKFQIKGAKEAEKGYGIIKKGADILTKGYESLFGLNKTSSLYEPIKLTQVGDWNPDLNFTDWSNNIKGYFPYPTEKHIMYQGLLNPAEINTIKTVPNNPLQLKSLLSNKYNTEIGTQSSLLKSTNKYGEVSGQSILDLINNKNTSILDKSILEKTYTGLSLTPKSKINLNMFKENVSNNIIQFQPVLTDRYANMGMEELGYKRPDNYVNTHHYTTERGHGPFNEITQNQTILWKDASQYKKNQLFPADAGDMNSPKFGDLISPDENHFNPTKYGNVFGHSRFFVDLENKRRITFLEGQADESSGYHKVMEVVDREKRAILGGYTEYGDRADFSTKFPILLNKIKTSEHGMITNYVNLPTLGVDKKKAQWLRLFDKATPGSTTEELEAIAKKINEFKYGEYDRIPRGNPHEGKTVGPHTEQLMKDHNFGPVVDPLFTFNTPEILGPFYVEPNVVKLDDLYTHGMHTSQPYIKDPSLGPKDIPTSDKVWEIGINGHLGDSPTYTELIKWRDDNLIMWDIQKNITQEADKLYLQFLKDRGISNELSAEQLNINLQRKAVVQAEQLRLVSDELSYAGANGFTTYRRATPETAAKVENFNSQLHIPNIDLRDYVEEPWTHINVAEFKSNVIDLFSKNSYSHTKIAKKYGPFVVIPENANKFILNSDKGTKTEMSAQSFKDMATDQRNQEEFGRSVDRWVDRSVPVSGDDYYAPWSSDFITTHHEHYGQIPDDFINPTDMYNPPIAKPTYKIQVREKAYTDLPTQPHFETSLNSIDIPENIVNNIKPGMYRIQDDGSWTYYDEIGSDLKYYTNMVDGIEEIAMGVRSEYHIPKAKRPPFDISIYSKEQQTILRKYSTFPKDIAAILGPDYPVRTVVDNKGNTWWEIDVPVDFKTGKGERPGMRYGGELPKAQFGIDWSEILNKPNESKVGEDKDLYKDTKKVEINGEIYYAYTLQEGDNPHRVSTKFGLWNDTQILDNINGKFYKSDKEGGYKGIDYAKNNNDFWAGKDILVGGPEFEKHVKYNNDRNAYINSFQDITDPYLMSMITAIGETETGSKVNYTIPKDRKYITDVDMDTSGAPILGGLYDQDRNPWTGVVGSNDKAYTYKSTSRDPALGRFGIKGTHLNKYAVDVLGYKVGDDFTKKYLKSKDDQQKLMKYLITDIYPKELSKLRHFNAKNSSQYSDFQLLLALHKGGYGEVDEQLKEGEFSTESTSGDMSIGGYIEKASRYLNPKLDISNNQYFIPQNSYHLPYNTIPGYKKFGGSIGKLETPMKNKVISDMINNGAFLPEFKEGSEMNLKGILGNYNMRKGYDDDYSLPYVEYTMPNEKLKDNKIYYDKDDVDGTNDFNIIDIYSQREEQEREHLRVKAMIKKYNNGENLSHTEQKYMEELDLLDSSPTRIEIEEESENKHPGSNLSAMDVDIKKDLVNKTNRNSYGISLDNQISLYLKHINSENIISDFSDKISKIYNKLNTVYYNDAKAHKMTVIDYMKSLNN